MPGQLWSHLRDDGHLTLRYHHFDDFVFWAMFDISECCVWMSVLSGNPAWERVA